MLICLFQSERKTFAISVKLVEAGVILKEIMSDLEESITLSKKMVNDKRLKILKIFFLYFKINTTFQLRRSLKINVAIEICGMLVSILFIAMNLRKILECHADECARVGFADFELEFLL